MWFFILLFFLSIPAILVTSVQIYRKRYFYDTGSWKTALFVSLALIPISFAGCIITFPSSLPASSTNTIEKQAVDYPAAPTPTIAIANADKLEATNDEKQAMVFFAQYLDAINRQDRDTLIAMDKTLQHETTQQRDQWFKTAYQAKSLALHYVEITNSTDQNLEVICLYSYCKKNDNSPVKNVYHSLGKYTLSRSGDHWLLEKGSPYKDELKDTERLNLWFDLRGNTKNRYGTDNLSEILGY